jgi:hypothetical protein
MAKYLSRSRWVAWERASMGEPPSVTATQVRAATGFVRPVHRGPPAQCKSETNPLPSGGALSVVGFPLVGRGSGGRHSPGVGVSYRGVPPPWGRRPRDDGTAGIGQESP